MIRSHDPPGWTSDHARSGERGAGSAAALARKPARLRFPGASFQFGQTPSVSSNSMVVEGLNDSLFSRTGKRLLGGDIGRHFSEGYCMKKTPGCAVSRPEPPPTINESATVRPRGLVNTGGAHRDQPRTIVLGRARSFRLSRTSHSIGNIRIRFCNKGAIFQSPRERTRPEVEVHAVQTD